MRAVPGDSHRWTLRQWALSIAGVLLFQVAVIWFAGEPQVRSPARLTNEMAFHLTADRWAMSKISDWPGLEDPTLFALPSMQGFSGPAWMTFHPMHYELKPYAEPPAFLELGQVKLAQSFMEMVTTNYAPPILIANRPVPASSFAEFAGYRVPMPTQSLCRISGPLATRKVTALLPLPSWPHTDLLSNSVVQLLVDAGGLPVTARIEVASGLPEADRFALELARQARFEPIATPPIVAAPAKNFMWGKLLFQWHVVPLVNTNPPASPP